MPSDSADSPEVRDWFKANIKRKKSMSDEQTRALQLFRMHAFAADQKLGESSTSLQSDDAELHSESALETHKSTSSSASSKSLYETVQLPEKSKVSKNEWIALKLVEMYEQAALLYSLVRDTHQTKFRGKGEGFPPGYAYRVPGVDIKNGAQYVDVTFEWIEEQLEDTRVFPQTLREDFPKDYLKRVKTIAKRILRVYAMMYSSCYKPFREIRATDHLQQAFEQLFYFVKVYDLIDKRYEWEPFHKSHIRNKGIDVRKLEEEFELEQQNMLERLGEMDFERPAAEKSNNEGAPRPLQERGNSIIYLEEGGLVTALEL